MCAHAMLITVTHTDRLRYADWLQISETYSEVHMGKRNSLFNVCVITGNILQQQLIIVI